MSKRNIKRSYNRILEISEDAKQITMPDSRYYRRNGEYYPSVTYVLGTYPKGKYFEDWLKKVGYSADHIVRKAADEGTQVHEMCEAFLLGEELTFLNKNGNPKYHPDVWQMFLRFVDFWEEYNPTLIETEVHLFSDEYKVAGTCDLVCEIGDELWVIDFKTSNKERKDSYNENYYIQACAYSYMFEERNGQQAEQCVILVVTEDGTVQEFIKQRDDYIPLLNDAIEQWNKELE